MTTLDSQTPVKSTDGMEVLDACHRETIVALDKLAALVVRLDQEGTDDTARALARDVVQHFSVTARRHHEDEERHLFPALVQGGDPLMIEAVLRLQQDHDWLEEDWMTLSPHIDAVACGMSGYDPDVLREAAEIFGALSHDHIALEEGVIYPQARERLGQRERAEMGREMAARRRGLSRKPSRVG
jgi:hemerythrin-like domain-containing protein